VNTAAAFAQADKRVLIVDADLRKPSLHKRLQLDNSRGLTNLLTHQEELSKLIQKTGIPNVYAIAAGPSSPNPAELLSSDKLRELTALAPGKFDIVIIDSPPVLGLADALLIANVAHATMLVVSAGESGKRTLLDAVKRLKRTNANLVGVLMGKMKAGTGYGSHYDYYYSYGADRAGKAQKEGT
jgi:capsular exopolysaccharide synthesis family protein